MIDAQTYGAICTHADTDPQVPQTAPSLFD
jgi:hypothetical protein